MVIFFKKKKIVLTAFTDDEHLLKMFPPSYSRLNRPAYYKNMPTSFPTKSNVPMLPPNSAHLGSTIRHCYGINKFNTEGFILPLWSDYVVIMKEQLCHVFSTGTFTCNIHSNEQAPGLLDDYHILKFESPWVFKCNSDIQFAFVQNFYSAHSDFYCIPPGVTDYHNQVTSSIFVLVNKKQSDKEIFFKAGTPLVKLLPLTSENVEIRVELVDNIKRLEQKPNKYFFNNGLSRMIKAKKQTDEQKCPFTK